MAISFKYNSLDDKFSNDSKKPTIKVTLKGDGAIPITVVGLIDSGADVSVIPKGLAEFLNLKFENKEESKGIGGKIVVWNSRVEMSVKKGHEKYTFRNIPVQIASNDDIPIIIGRRGFFEKFEITIDERKEKVRLKRKTN